jgi:hypothetical protein
MTGLHAVSDVCCAGCQTVVGWKYVRGREGGREEGREEGLKTQLCMALWAGWCDRDGSAGSGPGRSEAGVTSG